MLNWRSKGLLRDFEIFAQPSPHLTSGIEIWLSSFLMYKVEKYLNKHELQLPTIYNDIQRQKNSAAAQTGD